MTVARYGRGSACIVEGRDEKCLTRPAGKGKDKVMEEKENTDAREEQEAKEHCITRTQ